MEKKKLGAGFGVMILRDNKVLLGKRHDEKEKADSALRGEGTWTMPGGKLEYGESFEDGAIREVKEEAGLIIKGPKVFCVNNDLNEFAHFVTIGLLVEDENVIGDPKVMEPDEITSWGWFSLEDLPNPMYLPSANVLKNFRRSEFYIVK